MNIYKMLNKKLNKAKGHIQGMKIENPQVDNMVIN